MPCSGIGGTTLWHGFGTWGYRKLAGSINLHNRVTLTRFSVPLIPTTQAMDLTGLAWRTPLGRTTIWPLCYDLLRR